MSPIKKGRAGFAASRGRISENAGSEIKTGSKLHQPGVAVHPGDFSCRPGAQVGNRQVEVGMVEHIENIRAQLELLAFAHGEVLMQRQIEISVVWSVKRITPHIAHAAGPGIEK